MSRRIPARALLGVFVAVAVAFVSCSGSREDGPIEAEQRRRIAELERELAECRLAAIAPPADDEPEAIAAIAAPPAPEVGTWIERDSTDDLTGRPIHTREALSRDTFELPAPYEGEQRARLVIRQHPRFGDDVLLQIRQGQFICHYPDCRIEIVFDGADPVSSRAVAPEDGSTTTLFLRDAPRFMRSAERAHEIRIAATIYEAGTHVFVFPGLAE